MVLEDNSHRSINTTERSEQPDPENALVGRGAEDPEQNTVKEYQDGPPDKSPPDKSPGALKLSLIAVGLCFAVFLYSLDQTIVSNAIPSITDDFHRSSDEGWYGSSYLLTTAAFQLFYGRLYSNFSIKYTLLTAIAIFELGSLICGVAPTSIVLITGRAIAGVGCAGITSGTYIIIAHTFPLRFRPIFIASIAMVFAVAAVLGPVLGGMLTTKLTWRWCFYINLPFGGIATFFLLFFLPSPQRPELSSVPLKEKLKRIDLIGLLVFIPTIVSLLLALEWGGSTYPWSNGRIIALFVVFGVLLIAFIAFERWKGADATLPIRIITQRTVAAATWNSFCNGAAFFFLIYYVPFWQQVIRDASAAASGISLLPFVLGVVIMANLVGFLVNRFGYYAPFMILSSIITPVGEGLMTTWTVNTSFSKWVGYQALTGLGIGMGQQQPQVAIQAVLPKADIPAGVSIVVLVQTLSGAIFIAVGQAVLQNKFVQNLEAAFPNGGFDASRLSMVGATQLRSLVPPHQLQAVLVAYNSALTQVYTVALCMSALTIIGSLSIEWKSVRKAKQ